MGFPVSCVIYRESMVKAAGYVYDIPRDLNGFLKLCRALKARGTPPGFALGNAIGDGTTGCHWLVWSHGGKLVDEGDRVVINPKKTIAALEYAKDLYPTLVPGTPSVARSEQQQGVSREPDQPHLQRHFDLLRREDFARPGPESDRSRHAACSLSDRTGGDGRQSYPRSHQPGCSTTRRIRMRRASTCASCWSASNTKRGSGHRSATLRNRYALTSRTRSGPKIPNTSRSGMGRAMTLHPGYAGKEGAASAGCVADFIIVNMVAEAATGQVSSSSGSSAGGVRAGTALLQNVSWRRRSNARVQERMKWEDGVRGRYYWLRRKN